MVWHTKNTTSSQDSGYTKRKCVTVRLRYDISGHLGSLAILVLKYLQASHFLEAFCGIVTACSVYTTPHSSRPVSITQVQLSSVYELPGEQGSNMYMVWGEGTRVGVCNSQGGLGIV